MDLLCRHCGEAWDMDDCADVGIRWFISAGCAAFPGVSCITPHNADIDAAVSTVYQMCGDDYDCAASMFEDMGGDVLGILGDTY